MSPQVEGGNNAPVAPAGAGLPIDLEFDGSCHLPSHCLHSSRIRDASENDEGLPRIDPL